ncbi:hypothetical protein ACIBCM_24735 [Streptomyces sp. NPDC051018]|uniref:hypothetical protein n=1 Tax=Streptomyces sp. NPDC051018 TaxID=3365639 RepID=UPI0037943137
MRSTTTAKKAGNLVSMALWAASGLTASACVAVEPRPLPPPDPGITSPAPAARPQIVQGPGREALEAPPVPPSSAAPVPTSSAEPSRVRQPRKPRASEPPVRRTAPVPRPGPRVPLPPLPALPSLGPDVCALGESYGGWRRDGPEARMCRQASGA